MLASFVKGAWIGLCIAAPVGPIGTLVLKKSLQQGFRIGVICGAGAALADLCYGLAASAGLRLAAGYSRAIAVVGGIFLVWLAFKSWREAQVEQAIDVSRQSPLGNLATTFLLTLSNPMTIVSFAALIASVGSDAPLWFVSGVFTGSMLWWFVLSSASSSVGRFVEIRSQVINRAASLVLAAFGIWAIYSRVAR
jgi:threonine/homoserine/homoserine lactone efflux protein